MKTLNIIIGLVVVIVVGGFFITFKGRYYWAGHAIIGIISFILAIIMPFLGAMIKGRIKRIKGINLLKIHKRLAILLGSLLIVMFPYGLWVTTWHFGFRMYFPKSFHGLLGFSIFILAIAQVLPSLLTKKRKHLQIPHRIIGYVLPLLMITQLVWGIRLALRALGAWT
jgi:hypothetical protein